MSGSTVPGRSDVDVLEIFEGWSDVVLVGVEGSEVTLTLAFVPIEDVISAVCVSGNSVVGVEVFTG